MRTLLTHFIYERAINVFFDTVGKNFNTTTPDYYKVGDSLFKLKITKHIDIISIEFGQDHYLGDIELFDYTYYLATVLSVSSTGITIKADRLSIIAWDSNYHLIDEKTVYEDSLRNVFIPYNMIEK
jgi:hypothetical protein